MLVVGLGGLGSPCALYLAAAGVGKLGLIDPDVVEIENLHRQILYTEASKGQPKTEQAKRALLHLNPEIAIEIHEGKLTRENAAAIIGGYDVVCDGADNFAARYATNLGAVETGTPNVHASIHRFQGRIAAFEPGGPCYQCLFPAPPQETFAPNCAEAGVLGASVGALGALQAQRAIQRLLGHAFLPELIHFDLENLKTESYRFERNPLCPICAHAPNWRTSGHSERRPPTPSSMSALPEIQPQDLAALLRTPKPPKLLDVREAEELEISRLEGAVHIPLGTLADRVKELDSSSEWVVICRSGARSANATAYLLHEGFVSVKNLSGGINRWAKEIDPSLAVY